MKTFALAILVFCSVLNFARAEEVRTVTYSPIRMGWSTEHALEPAIQKAAADSGADVTFTRINWRFFSPDFKLEISGTENEIETFLSLLSEINQPRPAGAFKLMLEQFRYENSKIK